MQECGNERKGRSWWAWLRIALVCAMVVALVVFADPVRLWRVLAGAKYLWVLAAIPFVFAGAVFDSLRLYLLMLPHGYRSRWLSVLRTNLVVNFASALLPVGAVGGGVVAWFRLSKPQGLKAQTFAALSVNMLLKLIVVSSLAAAGAALDVHSACVHPSLVGLLMAGAAIPIACLALLLWTNLTALLLRFNRHWLSRILPERIVRAGDRALESFQTYKVNKGILFVAMGAGFCRKLVGMGCPILVLYAVGIHDISFVRLLWIMCAVEVAGMLPLGIAGLGLPQMSYVGLLALFQVGADKALASNLLAYIPLVSLYLCGAAILFSEMFPETDKPG